MRTCETCGSELRSDGYCPSCIELIPNRADPATMTPDERADELMALADKPLRVPFADVLWPRIDKLVGRPVFTHELARPDVLCKQIRGEEQMNHPLESLRDIVGPDKPIIEVVIGADE